MQKEEAKKAHASVDSQFRTLYSDKYLPLKAEAGGLRAELAGLQKRVVAEELKVGWLMCLVCAMSCRLLCVGFVHRALLLGGWVGGWRAQLLQLRCWH